MAIVVRTTSWTTKAPLPPALWERHGAVGQQRAQMVPV